eukprot:gene2864-3663_t
MGSEYQVKVDDRMTWDEFKAKQKAEQHAKEELAANEEVQLREFRRLLDADRNGKLSRGRNHKDLAKVEKSSKRKREHKDKKSKSKKDEKKKSKKHKSKDKKGRKEKHTKKKKRKDDSGGSDSEDSSSENDSSSESEDEQKNEVPGEQRLSAFFD